MTVSSLRTRLRRLPMRTEPITPAPWNSRAALGFILLVMAAQLVFLLVGCDWDLCGDEAEYWAWSRRLDWSYYAKGPLIAYLIRAATALAGDASLALTGSLMPAVRLPAVLLGGLTAWGIYRLATETCRNPRAGLVAVLILPAIPLFRVGGLIMTVDTPLVCCWTWAAVWSYRAITRDEWRGWPISALLVALGIMAKYTMLAFPASVGLYLLIDRSQRRWLIQPGFWLLALGCALGMAPILYWNATHGWVAADQMSDRLGLSSSRNWGQVQTLVSFLGGEAAALGFWGLVAVLALGESAKQVVRPGEEAIPVERSGRLYLLCLWAVVWSACIGASLLGETEANWSAPAQVAALALIGAWLAPRCIQSLTVGRPTKALLFCGTIWVVGLIGLSLLQHTEWFYPLLARVVPAPSPEQPAPLRNYDPTCRMRAYRELAPVVEARVAALRAQGQDPFVLAPTSILASTLSFSMQDHPDVYCLAWSPGMAAMALNQHDVWRPNPRHDVDVFRGRPVVIVEDATQSKSYTQGAVDQGVVGRAEPSERVVVKRGEVVVGVWLVTVCHDYRGPQNVEEYRALLRTYGSSAYYSAQGSTPQGFVLGLFRDMLGRAPAPEELKLWTHVMSIQPRSLVITALAGRDLLPRKR